MGGFITIHQPMSVPPAGNLGRWHSVCENPAGGCSLCDVITPWPDMTRSNFFYQKMRKVCPIRYPKFGGAARRRFCTISEKPQGGVAPTPPPTWARVNPRGAGGGKFYPPSRIFAISQKRRRAAPPNFQYLFLHQFDTFPENLSEIRRKIFEKLTF